MQVCMQYMLACIYASMHAFMQYMLACIYASMHVFMQYMLACIYASMHAFMQCISCDSVITHVEHNTYIKTCSFLVDDLNFRLDRPITLSRMHDHHLSRLRLKPFLCVEENIAHSFAFFTTFFVVLFSQNR